MKILAIETSCDETGICLLEQQSNQESISLLGNALASQIALHAQYGGVFPAMAKRAHAEKIMPLIIECLSMAYTADDLLLPTSGTLGTDSLELMNSICTHEAELVAQLETFFNTYQKPDIDYIAVTVGPGLEPALWVGINTAKVLSLVWGIPVIPVNHMEGHVVTAAVMEQEHARVEASETQSQHDFRASGEHPSGVRTKDRENYVVTASPLTKNFSFRNLQFPLLALLVSGGHTELVLTHLYGNYEKIGQTRDDAVGEAFDKVARMLGLPYPGGPAVSKLAKEYRAQHTENNFVLPRPMLHSGDYDFSFSGIKTAVLYTIRDLGHELSDDERSAIAAAFEDAVVEVLIKKTLRAAEEYNIQTIVVGGGVAGNGFLRDQLIAQANIKLPHVEVLFPEPWLATDNAIMIGLAAYSRVINDTMQTYDALSLKANGNLSIQTK